MCMLYAKSQVTMAAWEMSSLISFDTAALVLSINHSSNATTTMQPINLPADGCRHIMISLGSCVPSPTYLDMVTSS